MRVREGKKNSSVDDERNANRLMDLGTLRVLRGIVSQKSYV